MITAFQNVGDVFFKTNKVQLNVEWIRKLSVDYEALKWWKKRWKLSKFHEILPEKNSKNPRNYG